MPQVKIRLNEREIRVKTTTSCLDLKKIYKPQADLIIYNGAVLTEEKARKIKVKSGDRVVLIKKGEVPDKKELEFLMVARHTPGVHEKVKKATVGIAGAGGLGSHVAIALARVGIGKLVIADFDVVEPSNLNRQAYTIDQIGKVKVKALKDNIKKVNPYIKVKIHAVKLTPENIPLIFKDVDVLVEAFDIAEEKVMLVENFKKNFPQKPVVLASGLAGYAPSNWIKTHKIGNSLFVVGDMKTEAKIGQGLMAPRVGIAAHHQANLVLRLILGKEE